MGINWGVGYFLSLSAMLFCTQLFRTWKYRKQIMYYEKKEDLPVFFGQNYIWFPEGYYFKVSSVNSKEKIEVKRINAFLPDIIPPAFVIDDREVVFLGKTDKSSISSFCERNTIPELKLEDLWERICRPWLDTQHTDQEVLENENILFKNGLGKEELKKIRRKIRLQMSMNYFSLEWAYLGQYDYLSGSIITKKKYWWTMDIALRNYKKS